LGFGRRTLGLLELTLVVNAVILQYDGNNVCFFYRQIVQRYDILLIQEIRDISETAIVTLLNEVNTQIG